MKRYLSILVLGIALLLPMSVKAAKIIPGFTCEKACATDKDDSCQQTCTLNLSGDIKNLSEFSADLTLSEGLTIKEIKPSGTFVDMSNGNSLKFTAAKPFTGSKVDVATIVVNVPKDAVDCSIGIKPTGADFESVTVDIEVEQEVVKTGATLPLAIIAVGLVAAGVVYFVSKKNTKMYKI